MSERFSEKSTLTSYAIMSLNSFLIHRWGRFLGGDVFPELREESGALDRVDEFVEPGDLVAGLVHVEEEHVLRVGRVVLLDVEIDIR